MRFKVYGKDIMSNVIPHYARLENTATPIITGWGNLTEDIVELRLADDLKRPTKQDVLEVGWEDFVWVTVDRDRETFEQIVKDLAATAEYLRNTYVTKPAETMAEAFQEGRLNGYNSVTNYIRTEYLKG